MKKILNLWLPVLIGMGAIFYASSIPGQKIPHVVTYQDTIFHFLAYFVLGLFFARALKTSYLNVTLISLAVFTCLFGVTYGVSDEYHQLFVPNRYCSGLDVFIDGFGALIGGTFFPLFNLKKVAG
ncbi:MAG: VanZ family protein [Candidatus Omnitrophica bacterium]|nr:VanZ family protein [Candidatus Omnitrophota bacterium]